MSNGTMHAFSGPPGTFSSFEVLQALAKEGKAPREQLRQVRESIPTVSRPEALMIAFMATDAFQTLDADTRLFAFNDLLSKYTAWKMKSDEEWWAELDRLVA